MYYMNQLLKGIAMSLLLCSCSIFSVDIYCSIQMAEWPHNQKPDYFEVRYYQNGNYYEKKLNYYSSLDLTLQKEKLFVAIAYPVWAESGFRGKPAGIFYRPGEDNGKFNWNSGPLATKLYAFSDKEKMNYINIDRILDTLTRLNQSSIWDFDYNIIAKDLAEGEFNYYSIDRLNSWPFDIPSNQGLWIPDDVGREIVEVNSSGIFSFERSQGSHRFISFENRTIKEVYVNQKGELLVVDLPF